MPLILSDRETLQLNPDAAVIVVSHDEARLRSYADRIMQMVDGDLRDAEQVEVGEGVA